MEMAISSATLCLSCTPFPRRSLQSLSSSSNSSFFNNTALLTQKNKTNRSLVLGRTRTRGLSCNCLFGLGVPELAVIAGVAALVFGPKQLPEVGRSIGKTVKSFQQSLWHKAHKLGTSVLHTPSQWKCLAAKEFESELKKEPDSGSELPMEKATVASEEEKQDIKVSSTKESS